jgi:Asp-tRNA(Asn)/Glu-tRNA(Gln) amidotransferase A subunit family amidase
MADEPEVLPDELSQETAGVEASNPEPEVELAVEPAIEEGEGEVESTPEDDFEELDWNGKTVKVPKGLKDGLMFQADYTRKTQEVAATRKELEAERERIAQQAKATEQELQARAQLQHIDSELKRFEQFDWARYQAYRQQDPIAADEAWNYVQHLRAQKGELSTTISQAEQARVEQANREVGERLQKTSEFARTLPGYSPQTEVEVIEFAREQGFTDDDLRRNMNPAVFKMLWLARLGQKTLNAPKKPAQQTPPPKPLETVSGKASAPIRKPISKMSIEEHAALFRKKKEAGLLK